MSDFKGMKMEGSRVPAEQIFNPDLKDAIEKMQADNSKENIDAMINEVVKAKFILPAKVTPTTQARTENGKTVMQQSTQVQFRLLENQKKEKFFGVFTDTEELEKWNGTQASHKVVTDFDSIAQMVMDPKSGVMGFVINAFGKSVTFPKNMVISIKQQRDYNRSIHSQKIEPGTKVQLGEPKVYPIDLMAALINHFSTEENVNAAYLRMMEQNNQKSYLIVVDFVGDMQSTFEAIAKVAKPYLDEIQLSMMPYSMEFARTAVKGVQPFYKKEEE